MMEHQSRNDKHDCKYAPDCSCCIYCAAAEDEALYEEGGQG